MAVLWPCKPSCSSGSFNECTIKKYSLFIGNGFSSSNDKDFGGLRGKKILVNVFIGKLVIFPNNELKYHCLVDIGLYKYRQLLQ